MVFPKLILNSTKEAIIDNGGRYSYEALNNQILTYQTFIKDNLESNNTVALISDYNFYSIALFFALASENHIIVPIISTNKEELDLRLIESNADYAIGLNGEVVKFEKLNKQVEDHQLILQLKEIKSSGLILFSSGSTGKPKAMIHNLNNLIENFEAKREKNITVLLFLMFDHIGGLNTLFGCLANRSTIVIPEDRNPEKVCRLIETHKVNVLPCSPTFLNLILLGNHHRNAELLSLRLITYGTEMMPESLLNKLSDEFPKVRFIQTFGTSETGISKTTSLTSKSTEVNLSDPNIEHKIVNNELWLKSKMQVLGYLNASMERFTDDGWFKTGDLVEESENGFLKIVGRKEEIINVGGEKVLPSEVEAVVLEMDEISDCTAFAYHNPITGQAVAVNVMVKDPNAVDIKKRIRKHCKSKMLPYKIPVKIKIVKEIEFGNRFKKIRPKS